jgi:arylsulfatase A-like enzyme
MVEAVDTELKRLIQAVDLSTTTVFFIGDNGTPGGVQAPPYKGQGAKSTRYENCCRVPLLIAGAGVVPGSAGVRVVDELVNAVDLFPTILGLTETPLPQARIDGVSLVPYLSGTVHPSPRN